VRYLQSKRLAGAKRPFIFERLETRTFLAGNVMVAVNSGELDITGDNANNSIQVTQLTSGAWKINGVNTQINGGSNSYTTTDPVTGNIVINLSGGSDTLKISNGNVSGALLINADDVPSTPQDGNDNVQVSNVITGLSTAGDDNSLIINLGNGNNTAKLSDVTTAGFGQVNSGVGNNTILLNVLRSTLVLQAVATMGCSRETENKTSRFPVPR
jgi:hypothetical protein